MDTIHQHLMLMSLRLARLALTPLLRLLQSLTTIPILVIQDPLTMGLTTGLTTALVITKSMLAEAGGDAVPAAATTVFLAAHRHFPST